MEPVGIDDASAFLARFQNGSLALFEATRYARGHKALYTLEINGEHASARWDLHDLHRLQWFDHRDEGRVRGWRSVHITDSDHPYMKHWWVPGLQIGYEHTFIHQFADFLKGLGEGKPTPPTFRDGLATDCVTDAVLKSAEDPPMGNRVRGQREGGGRAMKDIRVRHCRARRRHAGRASDARPAAGARTRRPATGRVRRRSRWPTTPGSNRIFDGSSMKDWDGDPAFWRAANGALTGQSSTENPVKQNTFLIWRGGAPKDFELKVEYRLSSTNSGIQIRSVQLPAGPDIGKWVMKGYQADIDAENQFTGQIYEERGRGFLAMRGQATFIPDGGPPRVIGNLQQTPDELKALIKTGDWNQVHLIARGSTITQILNGAVMSMVVDEDLKNRQLGGLIGFQMHVGPPMTVEFRNIWLKSL